MLLPSKQVKLPGMEKKAIDGYLNEIGSLAETLTGNPSIIQMFDSQVDLKRKSHLSCHGSQRDFDLGQVLEQQALTGDGGHKWNMNFIRLTWQQMLTAVKTAASIDIKLGWLSCFIVYRAPEQGQHRSTSISPLLIAVKKCADGVGRPRNSQRTFGESLLA